MLGCFICKSRIPFAIMIDSQGRIGQTDGAGRYSQITMRIKGILERSMMGLLDVFRTIWPSKETAAEDRKKMFWYLKRRTSYTAWKREANAFDRFSNVFKKQVSEEPVAKPRESIWGTDWRDRLPEIVKAQVLYERALAQMREGDRKMFLTDGIERLSTASSLGHDWYRELVHHGAQGDHFFDGKYLNDLICAVEAFCKCSEDTGYFQVSAAGGAVPEFSGQWIKSKLADACHLSSYPEVPAYSGELLLRTGEEVPVSGIYEAEAPYRDMHYLVAQTAAPFLGDYSARSRKKVSWRLLWQDDRYMDGHIPVEENTYFPLEENPVRLATPPIGAPVSVPTGELCPKSGIWVLLTEHHGGQYFGKGQKMPRSNKRNVTWVWVSSS